jgi:glycosyltransferase involved in cell wall biosynthesis
VWLVGRRLAARRIPAPRRPAGVPHRIAHVTDVFLPHLGGIETHVDDLVRHQRARGLDVVVLTPSPASADDPSWVRRMPLSQARRIIGEYDVAHVHLSMLSAYSIGVARAAMASGVPTLMTVHSMWAGAGGVVRLAAIAALRRWPVAWAAVSNAAAEAFRRSLPAREVAVLPNAIDVACWRPPVVPTSTPRPRPRVEVQVEEPVTLVSVMRLMPRKRPLQLLKIFERVRALTPDRDVRLVIVGDGPLRRRMERFTERHGLTAAVRFAGRIPRSAVLDELLDASLYVAPAPKESFGLAALEARCAGLPVVAHRKSGVQEFIRDRVEGLLVADDVEMAVAIADLVLDGELRRRIATHNRRVVPPFDWSGALDRTDALYRKAQDAVGAHHGLVHPALLPSPPVALEA